MGAIAASRIKIPGDLARNNLVWAIGDSITANGGAFPLVLPLNWLQRAVFASNSRIRPGQVTGAGGYRADQVRDVILPAVLTATPRPGCCVVLAGTNDVGQSIALSVTKQSLTDIYQRLRGAGIVPICCSIPPRGSASTAFNQATRAINAWVARYAHDHGLPFVDFYGALVDPTTGGYTSAYTSDVQFIHPNTVGAKVMGQTLADALTPSLPPWRPMLPADNTDAVGYQTNPLMLVDANADGTPDNWGRASGATDATWTIDNPTSGDVVGKWMTIARNVGATSFTIARSANFTVTPGDVLAFMFRVKYTHGTGGKASVTLANAGNAAAILSPLYQWTEDLAASTFYQETVVPVGCTSVRVDVSIDTGGTATISVGQMQLRNLTALGIA